MGNGSIQAEMLLRREQNEVNRYKVAFVRPFCSDVDVGFRFNLVLNGFRIGIVIC